MFALFAIIVLSMSAMIAPTRKKKLSEADTKLLIAIPAENVSGVLEALEEGAKANIKNESGESALNIAINTSANIGIITLLLNQNKNKANPNQPIKGIKHSTPLFNAYIIGRPDIAQLLLTFGAEPKLDEKQYKRLQFKGFEIQKKRQKILKLIKEKDQSRK